MELDDLISRKALLERMKQKYEYTALLIQNGDSNLDHLAEGFVEVHNLIKSAPAVEAETVRHGRCEYCKDGKSFIGARLLLGNDGEWHKIIHCPNCGVKMDLEGNHEA